MDNYKAAQRHYDNLDEDDCKPPRRTTEDDWKRCRCCDEWKLVDEFQSRMSHHCLGCDKELSEV